MKSLADWRSAFLGETARCPELYVHSAVVALRSADLASRAGLAAEEHDICEALGLLHDIGKAPGLAVTGFHPLDGARFVESKGDKRLAALVAHHTGARYEAELLGMEIPYPLEQSAIADIAHYCDLTTLQDGTVTSLDERRADIVARYGTGSVVERALAAFWPEIKSVERRLENGFLAA